MRFIACAASTAVLACFVCGALPARAAGIPHDHLITTTSQGQAFMLAKTYEVAYGKLDQLRSLGAGVPEFAAHTCDTDGELQWYICALDAADHFYWPAGQYPELVFSDSISLVAKECFAHTGPPVGRVCYLGRTTNSYLVGDLDMVRSREHFGDKPLVAVLAGFPRGFKLHRGGRLVPWSPSDVVAVRMTRAPNVPVTSLMSPTSGGPPSRQK